MDEVAVSHAQRDAATMCTHMHTHTHTHLDLATAASRLTAWRAVSLASTRILSPCTSITITKETATITAHVLIEPHMELVRVTHSTARSHFTTRFRLRCAR